MIDSRTFDAFMAEVHQLLNGTAADKAYSELGPDGPNRLYEFVEETVGGPGHAAGEIIYKVRRYMARRNPEDLAKVGAWAFLMWRQHR